jgi:hypothetical protein
VEDKGEIMPQGNRETDEPGGNRQTAARELREFSRIS